MKEIFITPTEQTSHVEKKIDIQIMLSKGSQSLDALFKVSLFFGALISWCYFSFFVGVFPSFSSVGDVIGYIIFIVLWAVLIVLFVLLLSFFPYFIIRDLYLKNGNPKRAKNYISVYLALLPVLTTVVINVDFSLKWLNNYSGYYFAIIGLLIPLIFTFLFLRHPSFVLQKNKLAITEVLFMSGFYALLITFTILVSFEINHILVYLIAFFILLNILMIYVKKLTFKKSILIIIYSLMVFSVIISWTKIDNPIFVKPFELLKLGHYNAELHFKDDFITTYPFILNDENQSSGVFNILSSVGDEYVVKEIRVQEASRTDNVFYRFNIRGSNYYYENDSNTTYQKDKKGNFLKIGTSAKNYVYIQKEANLLREYGKNIDNQIYRIKKDDVIYEKVGRQFDNSFTSWLVNR